VTAFPAATSDDSSASAERPATPGIPAYQISQPTRTPPPPAPPYSLETVTFLLPSLADCAQSAVLGSDREMALAALMTGRLMAACLPPISLPQTERAIRSDRAKSWLSALTMPQQARMALVRAADASVLGGIDAAASLRELMNVLTGHLTPAALLELGGLAEGLCLYYDQTP
jgi:hypothetical protein